MSKHKQVNRRFDAAIPELPQFPEKLHRLLNIAYAAYGGAESMTLNDWRDLELQLKQRLENECKKCKR